MWRKRSAAGQLGGDLEAQGAAWLGRYQFQNILYIIIHIYNIYIIYVYIYIRIYNMYVAAYHYKIQSLTDSVVVAGFGAEKCWIGKPVKFFKRYSQL